MNAPIEENQSVGLVHFLRHFLANSAQHPQIFCKTFVVSIKKLKKRLRRSDHPSTRNSECYCLQFQINLIISQITSCLGTTEMKDKLLFQFPKFFLLKTSLNVNSRGISVKLETNVYYGNYAKLNWPEQINKL